MIPFLVPQFDGTEHSYIREALKEDNNCVASFEKGVAKVADAKYAVATQTGTAALHLALLAVGVTPRDLVIMPSLTFIATANAVSYCGAEPWLFDVDKDTWNISIELLERKLVDTCRRGKTGTFHIETGCRVSAIVPVYLFGLPSNLEELSNISKRYNIPIVADACQAFGSLYRGVGLQSRKFGIAATVFSFNRNKIITCISGGAVTTNKKDIAYTIRHLATTARNGPGYVHDMVGYNYAMSSISAGMGCSQLEKLDTFLHRKRHIRRIYETGFDKHSSIKLFPSGPELESSCWVSGIVIEDFPTTRRIRCIMEMLEMFSRRIYLPMHNQSQYKHCATTEQDVSDYLKSRVIMLPSSVGITQGEQELVIEKILDVL